ncbi:amidase signature domain-containing protein [Trichoderma sp. SZMC 28011]
MNRMLNCIPVQWRRDVSASDSIRIDSAPGIDGCYFSVSGVRYFAPRSKKDSRLPKTVGINLTTVFPVPPENSIYISEEWMRKHLDEYKTDDVFNEAFLANVVFLESLERNAFGRPHITKEAVNFLYEHGMKRYTKSSSSNYLPGPHVLVDQELREVWKLVDDSNGTCMVTLKPKKDPSDIPEALMIRGQDHALSFALPSRIKSKFQSLPLAGLRILIKDNIHLKGIKTSVGNRAFYDTYSPQQETAHCIQELVDKGVFIAGKTKMNSFGNWEEPIEYTDYQAPWNPRADGYQSTGGSSSGSAAAIAAYDWLDIAIGTDTWGSITRPAHWCGCFGLRPSIGSISTDGIVPYVQSWDVPGILARDLQKCRSFAEEWLDFDNFEKTPEKIIDSKQSSVAKSFAQDMAIKLNIKFDEISFEERWRSAPPSPYTPLLPQFINEVTYGLAYDVYHNSKDFRASYWEMFKRAPYTTMQNERLWHVGKHTSLGERDEGFRRIEVYRQWFQQTILTGDHTNAIIVMPLEDAAPRYRDDVPDFRRPPQDGINALALGPVMKSPVLAVPIAEIPYHSRISDREEKLPFAVALMGAPGTDLKLIDTAIQILQSLNLSTVVKTGRSMYED